MKLKTGFEEKGLFLRVFVQKDAFLWIFGLKCCFFWAFRIENAAAGCHFFYHWRAGKRAFFVVFLINSITVNCQKWPLNIFLVEEEPKFFEEDQVLSLHLTSSKNLVSYYYWIIKIIIVVITDKGGRGQCPSISPLCLIRTRSHRCHHRYKGGRGQCPSISPLCLMTIDVPEDITRSQIHIYYYFPF